ncbi:Glp-like protein [Mycena belliarum]|uniref:Glp-like protein n=1 Tax=Mycena belliarum TaxID=1033014 RepID=A0AAD6U8W5_9AGAR|nr:Glp-like protein [Mycena belliae]
MLAPKTAFFALFFLAAGVHAERHTVIFDNRCGRGTPMLIQGPNVLSTGGAYTSNGPLNSAIAYLQTGSCGFNGDGCTMVETTLKNPTTPGGGSSTDITLIPPHSFSVTTGFGYYNGCDNTGADCTNANCPTAFHFFNDNHVQVQCQKNDVNLVVTFCL